VPGKVRVEAEQAESAMEAMRRLKVGSGPQFDVVLRGKRGEEIKGRVDTASDSFIITSWTSPAKRTFTPQAAELPMTLDAYTPAGRNYDVPPDWDGKLNGWTFVLPAGRDMTTIRWNEGPPVRWKRASFGWGGLRNSSGKVVIGRGGVDETKRFRYVPMSGNGAADIVFARVEVRPVP
jgi:hypothetical protein